MGLMEAAFAAARAVDLLSTNLATLRRRSRVSDVDLDRALANAIRLGQMPEMTEALKRALGTEFAKK